MCVLHLLGFTALVCVTSASSYADLLADLQYLYNVEQVKNSPMPEYYSENPYADKMDDWGMMYPDVIDEPAPKKARDYGEAVLRDQEYMKQLPLSGYHFISGTAHHNHHHHHHHRRCHHHLVIFIVNI